MMIIALTIFAFSSWAVFSKYFRDGIVAKNFLSIAAITSFIVVMDKDNYFAGLVAVCALLCGLGWAWYRHRHKVFVPQPHVAPRHF